MHSHSTRVVLRYVFLALVSLCSLVWGATPAAASIPQSAPATVVHFEEETQDDQPASHEVQLLQNIVVKISLLAVVGIVLTLIPSAKMNLFENGVDIFFTAVISSIFAVLLLYDSAQHPIPLINRVVGMVLLVAMLIPYSLIANGGKIWTLLVIIPAKIVVSALVIICGICLFFISAISVVGRRRRIGGLFSFSLFGVATFGLGKLIQFTTRTYRDA